MDFSVLKDDVTYLLWGTFPQGPIGGAALTIIISLVAAILALLLGVMAGVLLVLYRGQKLGTFLELICSFLRSIPVIMLFFWTFYMLPVLLGVHISPLLTVIVSLGLIYAAYVAQSISAGIYAVGREQWAAGLSLGLTRWQCVRYILLPQAIRIMTPSLVNQGIALIKDTSLAYILTGVNELTRLSDQVNGRLMVYQLEVFLFSGAVYLVLCGSLEILGAVLQRKLKVR